VITVLGTFGATPTITICDLTVRNGAVGVNAGTADVILLRVIIHGMSSHGATGALGGRLEAVNCTLMSNGGDGLRGLGTSSSRNVVSGKNGGMGINVPAASAVSYTTAYGNLSNFSGGLAGTNNATSVAVFVNEAAGDFRETGLSPTVNTGDPADVFALERAPNGSRINRGAFGNTPWAAIKTGSSGGGGATSSGGGGGGGCGSTGLDLLWPLALLWIARRRRVLRRR
jgi:hypothetical protein